MSLPPKMEAMRITVQGRLKIIEARLAALETFAKKWEAEMAMRDVGIAPKTPLNSYGCVCPEGAERTCKGYGCPRIPHNMGPEPKAFVF